MDKEFEEIYAACLADKESEELHKQWHIPNKEELLRQERSDAAAYQRLWYAANRDKKMEYQREYRKSEKGKAVQRKYHLKIKDKKREYQKKYRASEENKEKQRKYWRKYRLKNIEKIRELRRKYYLENKK